MAKRVLLSAFDLIEQVQATLADHIGGDLNASAVKSLVESVLDVYCYGYPKGPLRVPTRDVLIGYGVPTEVVHQVENDLTTALLGVVQRGFGVVHPQRLYSYRWFNSVDVLVEEQTRALETLVPSEADDNFDIGYIPERMRRG